MYQAIKLTASNLHFVHELAPQCADSYVDEYNMNTECGITTYLTKQDFLGAKDGELNVYLISDEYGVYAAGKFAHIVDTEFKDVNI